MRNGAYQSLDLNIAQALKQRSVDFPGVVTCSPKDSLSAVFSLIKIRRVHRLVVVAGQDDPQPGRLVGVISLSDIMRALIVSREPSLELTVREPTYLSVEAELVPSLSIVHFEQKQRTPMVPSSSLLVRVPTRNVNLLDSAYYGKSWCLCNLYVSILRRVTCSLCQVMFGRR